MTLEWDFRQAGVEGAAMVVQERGEAEDRGGGSYWEGQKSLILEVFLGRTPRTC